MNCLDYFGFHEYDIKKAVEQAQDLLAKLGYDWDDFEDDVIERCRTEFDWYGPSNNFIKNIYEEVQYICEVRECEHDITYYVNGWDSHLYIDSVSVEKYNPKPKEEKEVER